MRTLLVAVLLLSLVASIYSQAVPTAEQAQCIADANAAQAADIVSDCGTASFTNVHHNVP